MAGTRAPAQIQTRSKYHAADILLRLLKSRRRPASAQAEPAPLSGIALAPAKQREVKFADFESVARLKERWGLAKDSLENWDRLWRQNPAMAAAKSQPSMGWVLETAHGIVGYQGNVPMLYQFEGRAMIAATAAGLVIEPAYRTRCITLLASFFRQRDVDLFVITHSTASVVNQSKALHARPLPRADYDKVLFWILDVHQFARVLAAKFGLGRGMEAVGAFLASSALRLDTLYRGPRGLPISKITEIEVNDIGDEFEALWRRKLGEVPRLLADRSPASLRWHFTLPGSCSTVAVLCCHRFQRLAGYAVVLHAIDRETGLRRSMLADILVEQDDPDVTEALLDAAYANAVASGGHLFEVVGLPGHIRQILMRWKPYVRTYPTDPLIYKTTDEALARALEDENAWYAGPFDGDATLLP
ncbi:MULTISPECIES: hypothetical protein [Bradyrhizobium]|uniref:hypothetical protein n=1 Tax=Bradyrhizobium elkanii TaxID=29448 RepID=UPI002714FB78|nr:hypothetical protein [Bradyrhizobium elkanii]WLA46118.1 hypothetical protein QIH80_30505 [Bradyrhizobium elkanii]WLB83611.1 hypothetical protein QIH83_14175 [Bradyrhizobium elkanii]